MNDMNDGPVWGHLGRNLLCMHCRNHIFEILLSEVYSLCFGPLCGPDIPMFKHFRQNLSKLNHSVPAQAKPLFNVSIELVSFVQSELHASHPRDDYLEILQLAAIAIGNEMDISLTSHHLWVL